MFNLDIESTDKARNIVNNVGKALVKKKVLILQSKEIDTINKTDIYDTCKDLYFSKKGRKEKMPRGIQSTNGLKARADARKIGNMKITVTTQINTLKKTFGKRFVILLDFAIFEYHVYPYELTEVLICKN